MFFSPEAIRRSGLAPNMGDEAFDRQCRIAKAALSVDTVFFAIVEEDRQFFPSHIGLPEPYGSAGETPISHSFCQHVVRSAEPLIIPDTAVEPLVVDNPARHDLSIASYLGVPVRDPDGIVIGTLCSSSSEVRLWSDDDVASLTDIATSIETELQLRAKSARLEARLSNDQLTQEYEEALGRISVATNRLQTIQSISDELAERAAPAIGASLTSIAIVENNQLDFTHASTVTPEVAQAWTSAPLDTEVPMAVAAATGRIIHLENREAFDEYPVFADLAVQLGLSSFRAVPFGDETVGLLGVLGIGWSEPMPADEVPWVLSRIVEVARTSLTRAWNFESEQNQARVLERVVLPTSLPDTANYKVAGVYIAPDAGQRVGGDVYDVIVRNDGAVGVMIADAVGHDLTATRAAARLRHAIGVLIMEGYSPADVMVAVNRYLGTSPSKRLVTCVCLLFAADGASVTVANAGHPQPILRTPHGARFIGPIGESLLGRGAIHYSEETVEINEGDFVLCFTDGLIDRRERSFIEGEQWLLDFTAEQPDHDPRQVTERLQAAVAGWAVEDDVAFLVVSRRTPGDKPELRWAHPAREIKLSDVREEIEAWTAETDIECSPDLLLVVNELVTNARDASQGDDDVLVVADTVHVDDVAEPLVRVRVSNRADPFNATATMPDSSSFRGRGLAMTNAVSHSLTIESQQGWIIVTALVDTTLDSST